MQEAGVINDDDDEDRDSGRDTGALRRGAANSSTSGKDELEQSLDSLERAALDGLELAIEPASDGRDVVLVEHELKERSNMHSGAAKASLRVAIGIELSQMLTAAIGIELNCSLGI